MSIPRKIVQYDTEGNQVRTYASIREAQDAYKITHISSVCRNRRKTDGGYRWAYADEELRKQTVG